MSTGILERIGAARRLPNRRSNPIVSKSSHSAIICAAKAGFIFLRTSTSSAALAQLCSGLGVAMTTSESLRANQEHRTATGLLCEPTCGHRLIMEPLDSGLYRLELGEPGLNL